MWRRAVASLSSDELHDGAIRGAIRTRKRSLVWSAFLFLLAPTLASAGVELVGHLDNRTEYEDVWGYDAPDGTALAIVGTQAGDAFVDVTVPSEPEEIAFFAGNSCAWRDIKTQGSYAYAVNDCNSDDCLRIYDLSDPLAPELVYSSSEFFRRAHNIYIDGDRLYAVGTFRGMVILDISDRDSPSEIGVLEEPYLHDIYVRNGIGYGAAFFEEMLILFDVSDPAAVSVISSRPYPDAATHNTWLTDDSQYCVTTDEAPTGHLRVFDVSDPAAPFQVSEFVNPRDPESIVHNVQIRDDLAYTSWYTSGLLVVSLQTPGLPQEVGSYDTFPGSGVGFDGAWGAYPYTDSGLIYVSDRQSGLYVLRYTQTHGDWVFDVQRTDTLEPLDGAQISFPGNQLVVQTKEGETAPLLLQEGEQPYEVSLFGFEPTSGTLRVVAEEVGRQSIELVPLPSGSVSGTVEAQGGRLDRVSVSIEGTPLEQHPDANGRFEFPSVPVGNYRLRTELFGYGSLVEEVEVVLGVERQVRPELKSALVAEDFESETGWTIGAPNDDATAGIWVRVDPNGTGMETRPVQPENDASPYGEFAFVTGNAEPGATIGENDVDGGTTTLISPVFDLSEAVNPVLEFERWFSSSDFPGNGDVFETFGSADGGQSWGLLSRIDSTEASWTRVQIPLRTFFAEPSILQLRFVVVDGETPTVVEAAIDDLQIYESDGSVTVELGRETAIGIPWPHPIHEGALLRFDLPAPVSAKLDLYDVSGRRVRALGSIALPAGGSAVPFDGKDDRGRRLSSGVYFLRLETPEETRSRAIWVVR